MPVNIRISEDIHTLLTDVIHELKGEVKKGDIQNFITKIILIFADIYLPEDSKIRPKLEELKKKYKIEVNNEDIKKFMDYSTRQIQIILREFSKNIEEIKETMKGVKDLFDLFKQISFENK